MDTVPRLAPQPQAEPAPKPKGAPVRMPGEPSRKHDRRTPALSWALMLLGVIVAAVLGFAGGYQSAPKSGPTTAREPVLAEARRVLQSFLSAPDWHHRTKWVLGGERVEAKMKAYYADHPDGPAPATRIVIQQCEANEATGRMLAVYRVFSTEHPKGIPLTVGETADGWKVDWESFVDFHDRLFRKFAEGKGGDRGTFRLLVRASPEPSMWADQTAYELKPPVPGPQQAAGVAKGTVAAAQLEELTSEGRTATPVVELARKTAPDGSTRLEIVSLSAVTWYPSE